MAERPEKSEVFIRTLIPCPWVLGGSALLAQLGPKAQISSHDFRDQVSAWKLGWETQTFGFLHLSLSSPRLLFISQVTLPHPFTAGFFPCLHNFCIRFTVPDSVINEEKIVEFISGKTQLLAASQGRMEHGHPHLQSRAWVAEPAAACVLCGASLGYVDLLRSLEGVEAGSP